MPRACFTTTIICIIVLTSALKFRKCRRRDVPAGSCCSGRQIYTDGYTKQGDTVCVDVFCKDGKLFEGKQCPCEDDFPCGCMHDGQFYDRETDIVKQDTDGTCSVTFCSDRGQLESAPIDCDHEFNMDACYVEGVRYSKNTDIKKHELDEESSECTVTYCDDAGQVKTAKFDCGEEINQIACYQHGMRYSKETDIEKHEADGKCTVTFCNDKGKVESKPVNCEEEIGTVACYVKGKRYSQGEAMSTKRDNGSCYDVYCAAHNTGLKLSDYYDC